MNIDHFNHRKLRLLRKFNGLTQEHFSELLNVSQSAYARMESGYTQSWAVHLNKICEVLKVSPEYFFNSDTTLVNIKEKEKEKSTSDKFISQYQKIIDEKELQIKELQIRLKKLETNQPIPA